MRVQLRFRWQSMPGLVVWSCLTLSCSSTIESRSPDVGADRSVVLARSTTFQYLQWPNGLRLVLVPDRRQSDFILSMVYLGGSRRDPASQSGRAHLFEHMASRRSRYHTSLKHAMKAEALHFNAETSRDAVKFISRWTSTEANVLKALQFEAERMYDLQFDEEEFAVEKNVVLNELANENLRFHAAGQREATQKLFGPHAYGLTPGGDPATIRTLSRQAIESFYREEIVPAHAIIVVTGNFSVDAVKEAIHGHFQKPKEGVGFGAVEPTFFSSGFFQATDLAMASFPQRACSWTPAAQLAFESLRSTWNDHSPDASATVALNLRDSGYVVAFAENASQLEATIRLEKADESNFKDALAVARAKLLRQYKKNFTNAWSLHQLISESAVQGDPRLAFRDYQGLQSATASDVDLALKRLLSSWKSGVSPCPESFDARNLQEREVRPPVDTKTEIGYEDHRLANGAVLVTAKEGSADTFKVRLSGSYGDFPEMQRSGLAYHFIPELLESWLKKGLRGTSASINVKPFDPRKPQLIQFDLETMLEEAPRVIQVLEKFLQGPSIEPSMLEEFIRDQTIQLQRASRQSDRRLIREIMNLKYKHQDPGSLDVVPSPAEEIRHLLKLDRNVVQRLLAGLDSRTLRLQVKAGSEDPVTMRIRSLVEQRKIAPAVQAIKAVTKDPDSFARQAASQTFHTTSKGPATIGMISVFDRPEKAAEQDLIRQASRVLEEGLDKVLRRENGLSYSFAVELEMMDDDPVASLTLVVYCEESALPQVKKHMKSLLEKDFARDRSQLDRFKTVEVTY